MYLEPVDGAAVDERGEHADPVPEGISNGAHGQHHVELLPHSIYKEVEEGQRCAVSLLRLLSLPDNMMREREGEEERGRDERCSHSGHFLGYEQSTVQYVMHSYTEDWPISIHW